MHDEKHYSGSEKRMYPRIPASGIITFKAYWANDDYYRSFYMENTNGLQFFKNTYGSADLLDISDGGLRIKTSSPLEEGYVLEVNVSEKQVALVRWISKADDNSYYAGLMYT